MILVALKKRFVFGFCTVVWTGMEKGENGIFFFFKVEVHYSSNPQSENTQAATGGAL